MDWGSLGKQHRDIWKTTKKILGHATLNKNSFFAKVSTIIMLSLVYCSFYSLAAVNPSAPNNMTNISVTTSSNPVGTVLNLTRANIYTVSISESQSTTKWTGIVGNISAKFALQDAQGNALYDWDIYTTTGEVYATKETTDGAGWAGGGVPDWTAIQCANSSDIHDEGLAFNSTYWGNSTPIYSEDSFISTWKDFTGTWPTWYVGERLVRDYATGAGAGEGCWTINLNENNSDVSDGGWLQIILTDNQTETETNLPQGSYGGSPNGIARNIIYAALIENNSFGYNGQTYDFQMILPQMGTKGNVATVPFYFYVELM